MEIGIVKQTDIRAEMQTAYLDYAMSVITARALPDVRDGLKPVQRRILYAMGEMGLRHNVAYKKSARIVGDVLGKYHPHGDQSVYDALVRMAQDFTMRYPLVDGQGNFGCFTGDTKIKLLDGTERSFAELAQLDSREVFYVYSVDKDGRIVVGEGRHARVTRRNARLIELTLDDGAIIRCTPDHKFMLRSGEYKAAKDLATADSLMPGYFDAAPVKDGLNEYLRVLQPATGEYELVHHLAAKFNEQRGWARLFKGPFVRHHKNFNRWDNRPTNIELIYQFGRENITRAVYEAHRNANWIPHYEKAIQYFESLDDLLNRAEKYNHRLIAKRWLDERADVYDITVDKYHNFLLAGGVFVHNSIDNDPPAQMRYTEARLTEIAEELLLDIDKGTVDFRPNFDDTLKEPAVLPAKAPNLLLNGTAGIAVGMATLMPPHNLGEVVEATNYLIDNWSKIDDVEPDDLIEYVKGPDFPTGGIILGTDGIKEAYATGKGRIVVRAKIHTEQAAGGKARIVVTELPYQVNKSALIERIAELVRDGRIAEIGDLRDESDRQGMSIIIELKRGVETTPVINALLKYTALQTAFSVNMLALVDGEPRVLSLKRVLQLFVQHRQVVITRRTQFELERAKLRAHLLEGLKIALDYLDEVIRTIRQSPDADAARERLMKHFKLTEMQATAILDMQLRRLAALERKKIEDELAEIKKRIKHLEDLLKSPKKILGVIKDECDDLKTRFGDARRTFISGSAETEFKEEMSAEEGAALVALTRDGNIRRASPSSYRRTRSDAVNGVQSREDDPIEQLLTASTLDNLVLLTNRGRALPLRMSQVPDVARSPSGLALANQIEKNERFVAALPLRGAGFITLATSGGKIKRTALEEFANLQTGGARVINLGEGDELGWACLTNGGGELLLVTAQGQALRFAEDDVPVQGRAAAGVWAIKLAEGDRVVGLDQVAKDGWLALASAKSFAKRVALKEFSTKGRYTGGTAAFPTDARTGAVAGARIVALDEDVTLLASSGLTLRVRVENLPKANRGSRGKQMLTLKEQDAVVAVTALVGRVEGQAITSAAREDDKGNGAEKANKATGSTAAADAKQMEMPLVGFKPLPKKK